jgi:hypothetical protein
MNKEEKPDVIITSLDVNPGFPDDFSYELSENFQYPFFLFVPYLIKERFSQIIEKIKSEEELHLDSFNPKILSRPQFRRVLFHFLQLPKRFSGEGLFVIPVEETYKEMEILADFICLDGIFLFIISPNKISLFYLNRGVEEKIEIKGISKDEYESL